MSAHSPMPNEDIAALLRFLRRFPSNVDIIKTGITLCGQLLSHYEEDATTLHTAPFADFVASLLQRHADEDGIQQECCKVIASIAPYIPPHIREQLESVRSITSSSLAASSKRGATQHAVTAAFMCATSMLTGSRKLQCDFVSAGGFATSNAIMEAWMHSEHVAVCYCGLLCIVTGGYNLEGSRAALTSGLSVCTKHKLHCTMLLGEVICLLCRMTCDLCGRSMHVGLASVRPAVMAFRIAFPFVTSTRPYSDITKLSVSLLLYVTWAIDPSAVVAWVVSWTCYHTCVQALRCREVCACPSFTCRQQRPAVCLLYSMLCRWRFLGDRNHEEVHERKPAWHVLGCAEQHHIPWRAAGGSIWCHQVACSCACIHGFISRC